ncbi:hypothetical protein SAMN05446037_1006110 [Anaerovirgula multivorans]|uniref:Uncharacterized protein n=1 Tax=Anaerovirgula multivorans TaxID=312168 RepID=A0A239CS93_9FIRM|nr:hypothetical protein [Anaerovirgula multivorans]SNS22638.1 hypothetical protein SAMN05446037_1006110 [Anaerovirgula multivorans]
MKVDKKTLMAVKQFLELQEGWDLDEVISEMVDDTKLLKHKEMGEHTLATDECGIEWGGDIICTLDDFVREYTEIFIGNMCNILDSFVDEDLSYGDFD